MAKTKSSVLRANKAAAKKTIKPKSSGAEPGEPSSGIAGQKSSAAVADVQEPGEEPLLRGLLIHSEEVDKILSGDKIFEIRNSFLRCVDEDESFYILRVFPKGTRNANGQSIVEIAGTVTFRTNQWIPHASFSEFFQHHLVSPEKYAAMRSGWKKESGGCVAWHIDLQEKFERPRYLPSGCQEQWYRFKWSSTYENKDDVPKAAGSARNRRPEKQSPTAPGNVAPGPAVSSSSSSPKQRAPIPPKHSMQQSLQTAPKKDGWGAKRELESEVKKTNCPTKMFKVVNEKTIELCPTVSHVASGERSVSSLSEAMSFYDSFLDDVIQRDGDGDDQDGPFDPATCTLDQLAEWLEDCSHSSAFSGVAAPETGLLGLHAAVQARIPHKKVRPPRIYSMTEWDKECQLELENYVRGLGQDTCLFTDISSFWREELNDVIKGLKKKPGMALETLSPVIVSKKAVKRKAFCVIHGKPCYIKCSKSHTAGSSCTAHSKQGKGLGLSDPNVLHFLAWCALRLEIGEPEATLENVFEFPSEVLHRLLGNEYHIDYCVMDPRMYGFPCARVRKYHRLRHKQSLLSQISPLARFHKRFFRMIEWSWKELLCTHLYDDGGVGGVTVIKDEMNAELQWASSRKLSMFNAFSQSAEFSRDSVKALIDHYGIDRVSSAKDTIIREGGPDRQPFLASLNVTEIEMREAHRERHPHQAWQLNQNPKSGHGMTSTDKWLHTFIHNMGLIWVDNVKEDCGRWLSPTEVLMAQAFPVHPELHKNWKFCPFNFPRTLRRPRAVCAQSGNSMSILCTYIIALHSAVCFRAPNRADRIVAEVSLFRAATLESSEKRDQDEKRKRKQVENAGLTAHPAKFRLRTKTPVPQEIEDIS